MPTIRQLTCTIESGDRLSLAEYGTSYTDGFVKTYIVVPSIPKPFSVHLVSNGYIASGLAMFVYIDGIYQCNRNRMNLKLPFDATDRTQYEVDLRVRQKEEKLQDGTWYGKEWIFEKLHVAAGDAQETSNAQPTIYDHLGTIEVVVLRCHSDSAAKPKPWGHYSLSPETSNCSATDMSEKLLNLAPVCSPKGQTQTSTSPSSSSSSAGSVVGFGLFDGANEMNKSHKASQTLECSLAFGLDGSYDNSHPPGPNGPRKEWTWSVQGNQGVYHKIGEQPFPQQQQPQGRIEISDGNTTSSSSTHFEQDWQNQARRRHRSRDRNGHLRSPSRRSNRRHEVSPHRRQSSHRQLGHDGHQAPPGSAKVSQAADNGISAGVGGVPATGPSPAVLIQVQQAPQPAPSIPSRGRSGYQKEKPSSEASRWPSLPRSVDSCATRMTPLTPSEIEGQRARYGLKPSSRASHAYSRAGDAEKRNTGDPTQWQLPVELNQSGGQQIGGGWSGNNENQNLRSARSHKSSMSHHTSNKTNNQQAGNDWATNNLNNNNTGREPAWGRDHGVTTAQAWNGINNSGNTGGSNPWVSNAGGVTNDQSNGDNTGWGAHGQTWGTGNTSNATQNVPGAWATSPVQENNGTWGGAAKENFSNGNANQGWDSANVATGAWNQNPSSNLGNTDRNNTTNNDNRIGGISPWERKTTSPVADNNWNTSNINTTGSVLNPHSNAATQDWAANVRNIFAKGVPQTGAKPQAAPEPTSSPVHGYYSIPNSPIPSPAASSPRPAPSQKGSLRPSQSASAHKTFVSPTETSFATIKPYWAKWHDSQTVQQDDVEGKQPSYTVPEDFARKTSTSHHVRPGKPALYAHRVHRPKYIDSHDQPYAVFIFKYRSKETLEQILGSPLTERFNDEKSRLSTMSKEELLNELMKAKTHSAISQTIAPSTTAKPVAAATSNQLANPQPAAAAKSRSVSWAGTNQPANNASSWIQPAQEPTSTNNWQRTSIPAATTAWTQQPAQQQTVKSNWQAPSSAPQNDKDDYQMSAADYENYVSGGSDWMKNHPACAANKTANTSNGNIANPNNGSWNNAKTYTSPVISVVDLAVGAGPQTSPVASVRNENTRNVGWSGSSGGGGNWQNTTMADNNGRAAWGGGGEMSEGGGVAGW